MTNNLPERPAVNAFCNDVLSDLDAVDIAAHIQRGEFSINEVLNASIKRIENVNPTLNALARETYELARTQSQSLPDGLMKGVPSLIKDNENVIGLPTLHGSAAFDEKPATRSSDFVKQFDSLGLMTLGKTTLPEFGLTATTESTHLPPTVNPWNTKFSCGGSSGGSAALVAAGAVPIAHGNDGGGSIRIPASCCGLIGLKPTRGRLHNIQGSEAMPINIVNQGVLTRTVRDTATFLYGAEKYCRNHELPALGHVDSPNDNKLRIGFFINGPEHILTDSDCASAVLKAVKHCESLGHIVEEIPFPFDSKLGDDFLVYWSLLAFSLHVASKHVVGQAAKKDKLEPLTKQMSRNYLTQAYKTPFSISRLKHFAHTYEKVFKDYDVIVSPVLGHPPPKIGYLVGEDISLNSAIERLRRYVPFTAIQNISGAPAISLPIAMSQTGLPIGVQFAASYGNDKSLIELAYALEASEAFHGNR
ncbi:amidase [Veronia nyctiphanis]|uniref:amidase n=1 Tax=Veronia nyctiphanis TaxID=1278244 RepID=UPI0013755D87|nr:amidase [Veronia nyctiphanis]